MMNKPKTIIPSLLFFAFLFVISFFMVSCGSSSNEQRQQEIRDSIKLEQDRKELLERANKLLESGVGNAEKEKDSLNAN